MNMASALGFSPMPATRIEERIGLLPRFESPISGSLVIPYRQHQDPGASYRSRRGYQHLDIRFRDGKKLSEAAIQEYFRNDKRR
jgi:hypothetical protein